MASVLKADPSPLALERPFDRSPFPSSSKPTVLTVRRLTIPALNPDYTNDTYFNYG